MLWGNEGVMETTSREQLLMCFPLAGLDMLCLRP